MISENELLNNVTNPQNDYSDLISTFASNNGQHLDTDKTSTSEEDNIHNYIIHRNNDGTVQMILCPADISEVDHMKILTLLKEQNEQIPSCSKNQNIYNLCQQTVIKNPDKDTVNDITLSIGLENVESQNILPPQTQGITFDVGKHILVEQGYDPNQEKLNHNLASGFSTEEALNPVAVDQDLIRFRNPQESVIKLVPKTDSASTKGTPNVLSSLDNNLEIHKTSSLVQLLEIPLQLDLQQLGLNYSNSLGIGESSAENRKEVHTPVQKFLKTIQIDPKKTVNAIFKAPKLISTKNPKLDTPESKSEVISLHGNAAGVSLANQTPVSKIPCFLCEEQFTSTISLKKHYRIHTNNKKNFKCTSCTISFRYENNFKVHLMNVHGNLEDSSNVCPICHKFFKRMASFLAHIRTHQTEEIAACGVCGAEFQNEPALLKHLVNHSLSKFRPLEKKKFSCPFCPSTFIDPAGLRDHKMIHFNIRSNRLRKTIPRRKRKTKASTTTFTCKICDKIFGSKALLVRHIRVHTGERPYLCSICGKGFAQTGTLKLHMAHHFDTKPYVCTLCGARFLQKSNLKTHILKTHDDLRGNKQPVYKCSQCPCMFKKVSSLNGHITKMHRKSLSQDSEPNVVAQVMKNLKILGSNKKEKVNVNVEENSKSALDSAGKMEIYEELGVGALKKHWVVTQVIDEIRYYLCDQCPQKCKKPSDLLRHFRKHNHEKPFKCHWCNKRVGLKSTLTNHLKIHMRTAVLTAEGRKANQNPQARLRASAKAKAWDQTPHYYSDSDSNVSENSFQCSDCSKKFLSAKLLYRHCATAHATFRPYRCQFCEEDFASLQICRTHVKSVHVVQSGGVKAKLLERIDNPVVKNSETLLEDDKGQNVAPNIANSQSSKSENQPENKSNNYQMVYVDLATANNELPTNSILINPLETVINNSGIVVEPNSVDPNTATFSGAKENLIDIEIAKLPVHIIDNADVTYTQQNLEEVIQNDFYNAQVICINCHQIYSDMNFFQKHDCPNKTHSTDQLLSYSIVTSNVSDNVELNNSKHTSSANNHSSSSVDGGNLEVSNNLNLSENGVFKKAKNISNIVDNIHRNIYKDNPNKTYEEVARIVLDSESCSNCPTTTQSTDELLSYSFVTSNIVDNVSKLSNTANKMSSSSVDDGNLEVLNSINVSENSVFKDAQNISNIVDSINRNNYKENSNNTYEEAARIVLDTENSSNCRTKTDCTDDVISYSLNSSVVNTYNKMSSSSVDDKSLEELNNLSVSENSVLKEAKNISNIVDSITRTIYKENSNKTNEEAAGIVLDTESSSNCSTKPLSTDEIFTYSFVTSNIVDNVKMNTKLINTAIKKSSSSADDGNLEVLNHLNVSENSVLENPNKTYEKFAGIILDTENDSEHGSFRLTEGTSLNFKIQSGQIITENKEVGVILLQPTDVITTSNIYHKQNSESKINLSALSNPVSVCHSVSNTDINVNKHVSNSLLLNNQKSNLKLDSHNEEQSDCDDLELRNQIHTEVHFPEEKPTPNVNKSITNINEFIDHDTPQPNINQLKDNDKSQPNINKLKDVVDTSQFLNEDLYETGVTKKKILHDEQKQVPKLKPKGNNIEVKPVKCKICGSEFKHVKLFKRHLEKSHKIRSAIILDRICSFCGREFQKPSDLQRHVRTHTGERPYQCDKCEKKFALKSTMEIHQKTHKKVEPTAKCDVCGAMFATKFTLKVHMNKHTGLNPYRCCFCPESFPSSSKRILHENRAHIKRLDETDKPTKPRKRVKAGVLKILEDEVTSNIPPVPQDPLADALREKDTLQVMQLVETLPVELPVIQQSMENGNVENGTQLSLDALIEQIQNSTVIFDLSSDKQQVFKQDPLKVSVNVRKTEKQIKVSAVQEKIVCLICRKVYASKDSLRNHRRKVHGPNKKYPCIKCDKTYATQEEMNLHTKLHAGLRPYQCKFCDNSFGSEGSLKTHVTRLHQGEDLNQETSNALYNLQFEIQESNVDANLM